MPDWSTIFFITLSLNFIGDRFDLVPLINLAPLTDDIGEIGCYFSLSSLLFYSSFYKLIMILFYLSYL